MAMKLNFEGQLIDFPGRFVRRSSKEALKLGAKAWAVCWLICLIFIFVPYVNISVFMVFIPLGPAVMAMIFFVSKKTIARIEGQTICPRCNNAMTILEKNVTPPIYESCPSCKCNFEIIVPGL